MRKRDSLFIGSAGLLVMAVPMPIVIAAEYLSVESAQRQFFPLAEHYEELKLVLTPEQKQTIGALAGPQPPRGKSRFWRATLGTEVLGYVFVDEVIGRQDFITYAVAIDVGGKLQPIEILSYRESHGGEIRNAAWRKQFAGRSTPAQLKFPTDIKNIAGATLSSEHVTQGVRWLTALWQTVLKTPAADTH